MTLQVFLAGESIVLRTRPVLRGAASGTNPDNVKLTIARKSTPTVFVLEDIPMLFNEASGDHEYVWQTELDLAPGIYIQHCVSEYGAYSSPDETEFIIEAPKVLK
ncbi:MAG: hypothetical protein HGB02_08525 [Chlorobiaceae bacterium]|nr:hypothetical protein [Chlorobiaceae bacterium]